MLVVLRKSEASSAICGTPAPAAYLSTSQWVSAAGAGRACYSAGPSIARLFASWSIL